MSTAVALSDQEETELFAALEETYNDPALFVERFFGVKPRSWQRKAWNEIGQKFAGGELRVRCLCRTCHGAGKTFFAAATVIWFMVTRYNSRGLTTAPTWSGVENLLWPEIAKLYNRSLFRALNFGRMLATELRLNEDTWFCVGAASDRPENLEGHHSDRSALRVVDEAKAVEANVFDATNGLLNSPEILDLWISTPSIETGHFFERDMGTDEDVVRVVVTVDDLIADEEISQDDRTGYAAWKRDCALEWGENSAEFQSRVMARYIDNAEGALFPSSWIERAMNTTFVTENEKTSKSWPRTAGMDVAGSIDGDQNAVAVVGIGDDDRVEYWDLPFWNERDTMVSKGRAIYTAKENKARLRIDTIGLGKGVTDQAKHDYPGNVEEYRASDKAREHERFSNRKAEDGWFFRRRLEAGKVAMKQLPEEAKRKLKRQMRAMKYEILQSGKLRVVDPEGDSPDLSDAAMIAQARSRVGFATADIEGL